MPASTTDPEPGYHGRSQARSPGGPGPYAATLILVAVALALPLMMGQRTPFTLTATQLVLVAGALLAGLLATLPLRGALPPPPRIWILFFALFTGTVLLQVLPLPALAQAFGAYPEALWRYADFAPRHWSPDIGASLRGWAAFVALFTIAWIAFGLRSAQRHGIWLALVATALFQAIYGVTAHASGADSILGIWPRNNPDFVHGTFSNRNLFAAYLALLWPLGVAVWWIREMPLLARLPRELKFAGSLLTGAVIGAALFASASRLGSAAALLGAAVGLLLWSRHRHMLHGHSVWPAYAFLVMAVLAAAWYGLTPLAERLLATELEDSRFQVFLLMVHEFPARWYLHGVGLGGFEAAFKQIQPGAISGWYDYAHNDLLQWLVEMGLVGALLLLLVIAGLLRAAHLSTERVALYAGLAALALVSLGDFSWHIPATQVVLALFVGVLLQERSRDGRRRRRHPGGSAASPSTSAQQP